MRNASQWLNWRILSNSFMNNTVPKISTSTLYTALVTNSYTASCRHAHLYNRYHLNWELCHIVLTRVHWLNSWKHFFLIQKKLSFSNMHAVSLDNRSHYFLYCMIFKSWEIRLKYCSMMCHQTFSLPWHYGILKYQIWTIIFYGYFTMSSSPQKPINIKIC